jgi:hypothetical protein
MIIAIFILVGVAAIAACVTRRNLQNAPLAMKTRLASTQFAAGGAGI